MLEAVTIALIWVSTLVLLVLVALRIWVHKKIVRKSPTISDYILLIAQACNITAAGLITQIAQFGLTRPEVFVNAEVFSVEWFIEMSHFPDELERCLKLGMAGIPLYYTILWFTKAAYIAVYYNLFHHLHKSVKIMLFCSSVYMAISYLVAILIFFLWCQPLSLTWSTGLDYCNVAQEKVVFTIGFVCNITTDLILFFIPVTLVNKLKLPPHDRWGVVFLYVVGCVSIFAGISRFILLQDYSNGNVREGRKAIILTFVEYTCGQVAICLPAIRTCFYAMRKKGQYGSKNFYVAHPVIKRGGDMEMGGRRSPSEQSQVERDDFGSETGLRIHGNQGRDF